jgi:hypothetical protein
MIDKVIFLTDGPAQSTADINNFASAVSFFVCEELESRGIKVIRENFKPWFNLSTSRVIERILSLPQVDAILLCKPLSQARKFGQQFNRPAFIHPLLKKSRTRKIYTILGATPKTGIAYEHAFTMAREANTRINWAADPIRCYPEQPKDQINVLIDSWKPHRKIWRSPKRKKRELQYASMVTAFHKLKFAALINISVSILNRNPPELDLLNPCNKPPKCLFTSWKNVVPYYRKSHIFCVTDPEEVGLSVIENAMCGAFIFLMDSEYLPRNFKDQILCCDGTRFPSMYEALLYAIRHIDTTGARKMAEKYSWEALVDTVLSVITSHIAKRG